MAFKPEPVKSAVGNNGNFDPSNPDTRFSRASGSGLAAVNEGWDGDVLINAVNRIRPVGGARLHLVATFNDLPQHVQDAAKEGGIAPGNFRGVTMAKGQVFLTQDTHSGEADLQATMLHEL